ncbi:MAG: hypothetical protein MUF68_02805 [Cyclobacteriaceae bacterium]|nr:hypothetical protein [Cyclobacteriaceae bacterium]
MQAITLFLLNKLSFLFNKKEINIEQLKAIVKVKLEINSRKTTGMLGQSTTGKQTSFTFGLILYSIFGFLFGSILLLQSSVLISFGILYAYIMVFIIMVLITDFSSVLLDTSDNTIILPKPVNSKTVFAARNTFIIIYISQIVLALSAGGIIFTFIKFGWIAGFLFIVSLAFITLFATNVTYALYLGVISLTSEETMKNTINYLQIVMTVIFMGSYQLLPRLMGNLEDFTHILEFETWMIFAPPLWYATLQALLVQQIKFGILPVIALGLGICLPFILQLGIQKYFIPFFNKKLQDLATQNKADSKPEKKSNSKNFSFSLFLKKLVLLKPLEQASYLLTIQSLKADRKLKLRIYPSLGYMFVFVIIIFISISRENENWFIELNTSNHFLWLIYLCGFLMNTAQFET